MRNNDRLFEFLGLLLLLFLAWLLIFGFIKLIRSLFGFVTVYSFQRGLLYRSGKLVRTLEPGRYFVNKITESVELVDIRETVANVVNQEIVCADNLALRLSSSVVYHVSDPVMMNEKARNFLEVLHLEIQLAMRQLVSGLKVEEVLQRRNELSTEFLSIIKASASTLGLTVDKGGIRDITFPGEVKKIFAQVAQAEKAGQAALAKSRGEVASLRALANAARMMDSNPHLVTLRTLQAVSELSAGTGNTVVFGLPPQMVPLHLPGKSGPTASSSPKDAEAESE